MSALRGQGLFGAYLTIRPRHCQDFESKRPNASYQRLLRVFLFVWAMIKAWLARMFPERRPPSDEDRKTAFRSFYQRRDN